MLDFRFQVLDLRLWLAGAVDSRWNVPAGSAMVTSLRCVDLTVKEVRERERSPLMPRGGYYQHSLMKCAPPPRLSLRRGAERGHDVSIHCRQHCRQCSVT